MTDELENPEVTKPKTETDLEIASQRRIDHIAEASAEQASHTEQSYDKEQPIFSK